MKSPYPKGKGKVHPSPSPHSPSAGGSGGGGFDTLAALRLLPAAILALTAALGESDKEVLAYLIVRSLKCHVAAEDSPAGASSHRPIIGCGCFECYTSFWSRWDSSPDREIIHQAIEAFEEHLTKSEKERKESRKKKRKGKEKLVEEPEKNETVEEEREKVLEESEAVSGETKEEAVMAEEKVLEEAETEAPAVTSPTMTGGEKKRGWADVIGIFNFRLWGA